MLRTEDQASKTTCLLSMASTTRKWCITDSCMAWRWGTIDDYENKPIQGSPGHYEHSPRGYCGLAGKPDAQTA